ncbi:MAG: sigma-70 family RNA polymerase sigma factor [Acaryochloridaceae cyanobacterium RU_4_10]|nr:sigma-70 family RNA polymerase sigma factor [Acaryochloridaceae cyanobacterium RU_4_10]
MGCVASEWSLIRLVDDEVLVSRISQGDRAAFSILYDRYSRVLYSFAMKSLNSREESEEVVLDVFSQVWRIADRYVASKGRVDTWLFMVTRSRIIDRLRKRQRTVPSENVFLQLSEIQSEQSGVDPFEDVVIAERREQVLAALKTLPEEQRSVIELAYYQGFSQSEIAQKTGLSLGTIKTRARLGLSKLKSALG